MLTLKENSVLQMSSDETLRRKADMIESRGGKKHLIARFICVLFKFLGGRGRKQEVVKRGGG